MGLAYTPRIRKLSRRLYCEGFRGRDVLLLRGLEEDGGEDRGVLGRTDGLEEDGGEDRGVLGRTDGLEDGMLEGRDRMVDPLGRTARGAEDVEGRDERTAPEVPLTAGAERFDLQDEDLSTDELRERLGETEVNPGETLWV